MIPIMKISLTLQSELVASCVLRALDRSMARLHNRILNIELAATIIQRWWRWVIADPGCTACHRRLHAEFNSMQM
jgi:hypothetical protein